MIHRTRHRQPHEGRCARRLATSGEHCRGFVNARFLSAFAVSSSQGTVRFAYPGTDSSTHSTHSGAAPAVTQLDQPPGFQGYSHGPQIVGVLGGSNVERQAGRERERVECRARRVARRSSKLVPKGSAVPRPGRELRASAGGTQRATLAAQAQEVRICGGTALARRFPTNACLASRALWRRGASAGLDPRLEAVGKGPVSAGR